MEMAARPSRLVINVGMDVSNSLVSVLRHDEPQSELCIALAEAALKNRKPDQRITVIGYAAKPTAD